MNIEALIKYINDEGVTDELNADVMEALGYRFVCEPYWGWRGPVEDAWPFGKPDFRVVAHLDAALPEQWQWGRICGTTPLMRRCVVFAESEDGREVRGAGHTESKAKLMALLNIKLAPPATDQPTWTPEVAAYHDAQDNARKDGSK